uniref:Family with sequence similarity 110 member D n=1 Tax=Myripristis murdjan TaxID=586833 RepID=A0A668A945_9TELE
MPVTMKPLTPIGSPSPLRLLNKGPDYLRRQIDGGGHGRSVSAVERLEADKAKYVKSQQVINSKQEPVLVPCATPPPQPRRPLVMPSTATTRLPPRRSSNTPFSTLSGSMPSPGFSCKLEQTKNGFTNGISEGTGTNGNLSHKHDDDNDPWRRASPPPPPRRQFGGLWRSKSDLRLRCSVALSEQEHFFDFCGLDTDMIERLGRENFLSGASSIDTLSLALRSVSGGGCGGSEPSEFSRHSGEGLFQEELTEQLPSGVSIIERNARVIKWLYGCKNAAREGPKESTV